MQLTRRPLLLLALVLLVALSIFLMWPLFSLKAPDQRTRTEPKRADSSTSSIPIATTSLSTSEDSDLVEIAETEEKLSAAPEDKFGALDSAQIAGLLPWEVAHKSPSDEEFYRIVKFLRKDPNFLAGVMQEFQSETSPRRLEWLAFMLGELHERPELTSLAGQMLFSGNPNSEIAALALLGRIQKHDPTARDLVLQALGSSQEPELLISAMNAISRATSDISSAQQQQIVHQLTPLTQHEQPTVRSHSYSMLFRWAADMPDMAQQLSAGLSDSDERVRRTTIIGFIDHPQQDEIIKLRLMDLLNSTMEPQRNRKLAAKALNNMQLNQDEIAHVRARVRTLR